MLSSLETSACSQKCVVLVTGACEDQMDLDMVQRRAIRTLEGRETSVWGQKFKNNQQQQCLEEGYRSGTMEVYSPGRKRGETSVPANRALTEAWIQPFQDDDKKFYLTRPISLLPAVWPQEVAQAENINRSQPGMCLCELPTEWRVSRCLNSGSLSL